jgi:hypothetical protein
MDNKRKTTFIILIGVILSYVIYDSLSQSVGKDLRGQFKELAFYRNEQNTGPVLRIYAVSLSDTLWKEMETYGNTMPHNKYGNTKVYYFLNQGEMPRSLSRVDGSFEKRYQENCIAKYEKGAMGQIVLVKYPFRQSSSQVYE